MPDPAPDPVAIAAARVNAAHRQLLDARTVLFRALAARARRGGRQRGVCGTPAGYRRHTRAGEPPCHACMDAKAWEKQRQTSRRSTGRAA